MSAHPLVVAAERLARDLLEPAAARVERAGVPRSHLDALAAAGLFGLLDVPRMVTRAVAETIGGACLTTWFVQAQHHHPVAMLAASDAPVRDRLLPRLLTGEIVAGLAFAHLRRHPDRPVEVRRAEGGWHFRGTAPWYTGWGLNDVALVAGLDAEDHTVWGFVDAGPGAPGLRPSEPIATLALAGALTVQLNLDVRIADADIVARIPLGEWLAADRERSSDANPAVFGVTAAALRLLTEAGATQSEAADLAGRLAARLDATRARCYALADAGADPVLRREARVDAWGLLTTATTAAVVAGGGRALLPEAAAGRLARWALFLLVQAQTAADRAATLRWMRHAAELGRPSGCGVDVRRR